MEDQASSDTKMALDVDFFSEYASGMSALRTIREAKGLSQSALAELANTSQPQIQRLEMGERKLTKEWAERLAKPLGIGAHDLMFPQLTKYSVAAPENPGLAATIPEAHSPNATLRGATKRRDRSWTVPLYGRAMAGSDGALIMDLPQETADWPFGIPGEEDYAVTVYGDSMEPRYFDGEKAWVRTTLAPAKGDFVVIQVRADDHDTVIAFVKRYVRWDSSGLLVEQYNPQKTITFDTKDVKAVHVVCWGGR